MHCEQGGTGGEWGKGGKHRQAHANVAAGAVLRKGALHRVP